VLGEPGDDLPARDHRHHEIEHENEPLLIPQVFQRFLAVRRRHQTKPAAP
jgi:hypothetical protein